MPFDLPIPRSRAPQRARRAERLRASLSAYLQQVGWTLRSILLRLLTQTKQEPSPRWTCTATHAVRRRQIWASDLRSTPSARSTDPLSLAPQLPVQRLRSKPEASAGSSPPKPRALLTSLSDNFLRSHAVYILCWYETYIVRFVSWEVQDSYEIDFGLGEGNVIY